MYFFWNKKLYLSTERNDERAIVAFKDFYNDVTLEDSSQVNKKNEITIQVRNGETESISKLHDFLKKNIGFKITAYKGAPLICIEPIGPAYSLNNSKLSADKKNSLSLPNVASLDKTQTITVSNDQSMAQIYTVSDIMQYAHASMFNLCLMYGNRILTKSEYEAKLKEQNSIILELMKQITKQPTKGN